MVIVEPATKRFNPLAIEPEACRNCSSEGLYRWGERKRKIKDRGFSEVMVKRYRCKACKRTFTAHPEGLGRSPQTIRYQAIRLTLWPLDLWLRQVPLVLSIFEAPFVSFMTVWRDVQRRGERCRCPDLRSRIVEWTPPLCR